MGDNPQDLNPWAPLIARIVEYLKANEGSRIFEPKAGYPGQMTAPMSPMFGMARELMMQRAASGGPEPWRKAGRFADMYGQGYERGGVFNPFTGQTEYPKQTQPQQPQTPKKSPQAM
jgi:hypothetical protein